MNTFNKIKIYMNLWTILSTAFVLLILLPNLNIFMNIFQKSNENWEHIKTYLLQDYIVNSTILMVASALLAIIAGTSLAWLVTAFDFPFKKFFRWALVLPIAIPAYIGAYTYSGMLSYTGIIQVALRNYFNIMPDQKYFDIMSMQGAIFIYTLFLYPYVYIFSKSFFEKQAASLVESARTLGKNNWQIFYKVVIPISRTAIVGGASLVILEILNDYGVVKYFGITTFSTAIYKTWFSLGDLNSAVRLSAILMFFVFMILTLEKFLRGRKKYSFVTTKIRPIAPAKLTGVKSMLTLFYTMAVFSLAFLIPVLQLIWWAYLAYKKNPQMIFADYIFNSIVIALVASLIIMLIAVIIANSNRINDTVLSKIYSKITILGYSIPGAVIAIGVIIFFINLDKELYPLYKMINPNTKKLLLSTSIVMLIFAYMIRFLAIGYNSIESGFDKIGTKFSEASRTLGMNSLQTFLKVDLIMIKPTLISGFFMVFVDVLKELPLTLILRPFNYNSLATKAFEYAKDEMIHEASLPSLMIILISIVSILIFYRATAKEEK